MDSDSQIYEQNVGPSVVNIVPINHMQE